MKIELTKKSIFVIAAILLIPTGVAFAQNFMGDDFANVIIGTKNNDKITAKGGSDLLFGFGNGMGGGPAEKLLGGNGDDELVGDDDPLGLCGSVLFPTCNPLMDIGSPGDDILEGGAGNDFVVGDNGNDESNEKASGNDITFGGAGNDGISLGNGQDVAYGGFGDDIILGGNGNDLLFGNWGNDDISGGNGNDVIDCGEDPNGLDMDIARVIVGADTWVNCEIVLDERTGDPINLNAVCSNNIVEEPEQCDDGNLVDGDGCSSSCTLEIGSGVCGNNIVEVGEQCDDGNTTGGDGCDAFCQVEGSVCGNSIVESGETCDDGNTVSGDGCSSVCIIEPICGNSIVESGETCDDGNTVSGDGCSSTCVSEAPPPPTGFDVQPLIDDVNILANDAVSNPALANKDKNQLINRLNDAQDAANDGDLVNACSKINNFDKIVNRLINKGDIDITVPDPTAQSLLDASQALQDDFC